MSENSVQDDVIPHGEAIVERFGGIRPMATKLNVPVTTVQGWKKRDAIPAMRRDEILSAAAHYDIDLKGLIAGIANQNSRIDQRGSIAEDPALAAAPRVSAQAAPAPSQAPAQSQAQAQPAAPAQQNTQQPRAQAAQRDGMRAYTRDELRQVRSTARRTSFLTTAALLAVLGTAGYLLFGQQAEPQRIQSLETRMSQIEQRARSNAAATNTATGNAQDGGLAAQVSDLGAVIGTSAAGLAEMARGIAGGNSPILQRLAVIEQQLTQNAGLPSALSNMASRMENMAQQGTMPGMAGPDGMMGGAMNGEWQNAIADLRNVVSGLQGQMSGLNGALEQARSENDALGRQLQDVSGRDLGAAAMLLALTELRESINRQAPFADDLALLRQVAGSQDPELAASVDKLAPYAQSGVLSSGGLKRELQASANDIISAKIRGEDVSVKDKVIGRLQGLFSVQKDGVAVAGGSAEDVLIKRASTQLDQGDVAGAMATLQRLEGPAAQAAQPWQNKAAATLAAQALDGQLVRTITNKIKAGLSGAGSTGGVTAGAGPINMRAAPAPQQALPSVITPPAIGDGSVTAPSTDGSAAPTPAPAMPSVTIQQ